MGSDETSSTPTVLINTSQPLKEIAKRGLQYKVTSKLYSAPHSIQIVFRQSRLRRAIDHRPLPGFLSPSLPPICPPRNIEFSITPGTGASIGIAGSLRDTATLGCYLFIDNKPMVLTVDHLIPGSIHATPVITHVSEQDRADLLFRQIEEFSSQYIFPSHHQCNLCDKLCSPWLRMVVQDVNCVNRDFDRSIWMSCPLFNEINTKFLSQETGICPAIPFASLYARSSRRYRVPIPNSPTQLPREMDWALFEISDDVRNESAWKLMDHLDHRILTRMHMGGLYVASLLPGGFVRSLGRTSGHQIGQISNTSGIIFHEEYQTQEWSVIRRPETSHDDWVEGGIGVDGDSGGLIVDNVTSAVYGMLWGRSGEGPQTVTLFTPLEEIFLDLKERHNVAVSFLQGQEMPQPGAKPRLGSNTLAPEFECVPITMAVDYARQGIALQQSTPVPGVRRLSSMEVGQRPFERYRGHDRSHHSVPRTLLTSEDADMTQGSQYPGSWTYTRQALEMEQED